MPSSISARALLSSTVSYKLPMSWLSAACLTLPLWLSSPAGAYDLAPQAKLRFNIVQWMPLKGEYQRWDALAGDVVISADGTISMPVIGTLSVTNKTTDELASEVANLLKTKLGLVDLPSASVEVVEFPPVYIVGSVSAPGAFPFRPGMTVLQALALSGGRLVSAAPNISTDRIRLVSDLHSSADSMLRSKARIARLLAEFSDAKKITFPAEVTGNQDGALSSEIMAQEETIFRARANDLTRQAASLSELSALYKAEIDAIKTRMAGIDESIASTESELAGVRTLLEKGIATLSRRSDLERLLANMRADRIDQITTILRAQQSLSETNRNAAKLADQRRTELAQELQDEQAKLEQLTLQQATSQNLLLQLEMDNPMLAASTDDPDTLLTFSVVRRNDTTVEQLKADENTLLMPGDVLKVVAPQVHPKAPLPMGGSTVALSELAATTPVAAN
jgi:protein involved in polysaccharide export with SLBB domain